MSDRKTPSFDEVADKLGVRVPRYVEYDFQLIRALKVLAKADIPGVQLVFAGGTSLRAAHGVVARMSDDADLRITSPRPLTRAELREVRRRLGEALRDAGFAFDPNNPQHLWSRNESRYTGLRIAFSPVTDGPPSAELQMEAVAFQLRAPPVTRPVASLVARSTGGPPEIESMLCVSLEETAADKLVGFTRRLSTSLAAGDALGDADLARHLYDLHMLAPRVDKDRVVNLARAITEDERTHYRGKSPEFAADPAKAATGVVRLLGEDPRWRTAFADYQSDVVYGEHVLFERAVASVAELVQRTWLHYEQGERQAAQEDVAATRQKRARPVLSVLDELASAEKHEGQLLEEWAELVQRSPEKAPAAVDGELPHSRLKNALDQAMRHRMQLEARFPTAQVQPAAGAPPLSTFRQVAAAWEEFRDKQPAVQVEQARRGEGPGAHLLARFRGTRQQLYRAAGEHLEFRREFGLKLERGGPSR